MTYNLQVGAIVYNHRRGMNPESKDSKSSSGDIDALVVKFKTAMDSVIRGSALNRSDSLSEQGIMVKTAGASQNRGNFSATKGQPAPKNAKEKSALENLRVEISKALPGGFTLSQL